MDDWKLASAGRLLINYCIKGVVATAGSSVGALPLKAT